MADFPVRADARVMRNAKLFAVKIPRAVKLFWEEVPAEDFLGVGQPEDNFPAAELPAAFFREDRADANPEMNVKNIAGNIRRPMLARVMEEEADLMDLGVVKA